jgi:hypothetical protein
MSNLPSTPSLPGAGKVERWDHSNSFIATMAVAAGADGGVAVPDKFWRDVQSHWEKYRFKNGQWGYSSADTEGTYAMSCAGTATLLATHDGIEAAATSMLLNPPAYSKAVSEGLAWLESGDNSVSPLGAKTYFVGYNLCALEQAAQRSGYKYFGRHDWLAELALISLSMQSQDGAFRHYSNDVDNLVETAFNILFLVRGKYPVMINKLRFDGAWNARPRDLANLARITSRQVGHPVNWQIVNATADYTDWLDAPILYIASAQAPRIAEEQLVNIKNYILAGGMLFTHADKSSPGMTQYVAELAQRMFPEYPMLDLPGDHPIYTIQQQIASPRPRLRGVSNGSRLLIVHSPTDLAGAWEARQEKGKHAMFEIATNLYVYAASKSDARGKLAPALYPKFDRPIVGTLNLARVKYAGNWNPEPFSWQRFGMFLQWDASLDLSATPVGPRELNAQYRVAHLTGTAAVHFSDEQIAGLRKYIDDGGVLFVEACGGANAFSESIEKELVPKLFGDAALETIAADHPVLKITYIGMDNVLTPGLRPETERKIGAGQRLKILNHGKGVLIFSPLDVSTALVNVQSPGVIGYQPLYAESLAKNIVLWAHARDAN